MTRVLLSLCLVAAVLSAQQPRDAKPPEKPSPRQKARELLDHAAAAISSTQPEVQVAGLLHIAELYAEFDRKKSLELFDQAFAAAAALPVSPVDKMGFMQSTIVATAAEIDVDKAVELLRQMPPPQTGRRDNRVSPISSIVRRLIAGKKFDAALELITGLGSEGEFAYRAAGDLFRALPEGDPRRTQLFAAAITAYSARPTGPFTDLVSRHWKEVPQQMAEAAVDAILRPLLAAKTESGFSRTISSSKGSVSFDSREDAELFNLIHVVQAIHPKRAEELLEKRIALREALAKFPEGVRSMGDDINTNTSMGGPRNPEDASRQRLESLAQNKSMEARAEAGKDLNRAVAIAEQIPLPAFRAATFASIAEGLAEKDPSQANAILTRAVKALADGKPSEMRVDTWIRIARTAFQAKDEERARQSLDKAFEDATALFKEDADPEKPNTALREYWPSTQYYRRIIHAAATFWSVDAENMLPRVTDPEIHQLVTIEMARALLKKPTRANNMMVERRGK